MEQSATICHRLGHRGEMSSKKEIAHRPVGLLRFYLVPNIAEEMAENRH